MGRFFFNLHDHTGFVQDEEGQECASLPRVRAAAVNGARSIMSHEVLEGVLDLTGRIDVFDSDGRLVLTLHFRDAVKVTP